MVVQDRRSKAVFCVKAQAAREHQQVTRRSSKHMHINAAGMCLEPRYSAGCGHAATLAVSSLGNQNSQIRRKS